MYSPLNIDNKSPDCAIKYQLNDPNYSLWPESVFSPSILCLAERHLYTACHIDAKTTPDSCEKLFANLHLRNSCLRLPYPPLIIRRSLSRWFIYTAHREFKFRHSQQIQLCCLPSDSGAY